MIERSIGAGGMRVLILGGDGYLGWPTAMRLAARGDVVMVVDNYLRRTLARDTRSEPLVATPPLPDRAAVLMAAAGLSLAVEIGDCTDQPFMDRVFCTFQPDAVVHYAEQPSAPYSMMGYDEARRTLHNNIGATFNVIWSVMRHVPECHIVKLGTMGEYGTPNIDIEEGWLDVTHKGRSDRFLFPRQGASLYHTTKIIDTDLLWFYVRTYGLRVTDLMQGPVYGLSTAEADMDSRLAPHFHYDDIFGTVLNRFLVQAVAGVPLTVYGSGDQIRGFLNLEDTLQCVELALRSPVERGVLRVLNQFTEQFSVRDLAERVTDVGSRLGFNVRVASVANPRKEREAHYYNPVHRALLDLGLEPHYLTDDVLANLLERVWCHRASIDVERIMPRVRWNPA
jgi:UDP-sulfoquinovose synthase